MTDIPVSLATEGQLDEQVLRRLIAQSGQPFAPGTCYGKRGRDQLHANVLRFNQAARHKPFIILADLERNRCAPELLRDWLPNGAHANLVLRVAVRQVESWLLADSAEFARFLGVPPNRLPVQPDQEKDAKRRIVLLARQSRYRIVRADLVPDPGSTSRVGKNYTGRLTEFVQSQWVVQRAAQNSPSLERALRALQRFRPV